MADQLLTGTTLVEKESRSVGDVPVGSVIEWDDTYVNIPDGFKLCDGAVVVDPLSAYNGIAVPNYNTKYYNIPGNDWVASSPEIDNVGIGINSFTASEDSVPARTIVQLPQGATVTSCICYGNAGATGESWYLQEITIGGTTTVTMATAAFGTEDVTITNPTIDNETYSYVLVSDPIDTGDIIYGTLITYTPRQKFIIRIK